MGGVENAIVFATYPLLAGVEKAGMIFNLVFFISLTSVLVQGTTLSLMARWLQVALPQTKPIAPANLGFFERVKTALTEIRIPPDSAAVGQKVVHLGFPRGAVIAMLHRDDAYLTPDGSTELAADDVLYVLTEQEGGIRKVYESLDIDPPGGEPVAL